MKTINRWLAAVSVALLLAGCADVPVATVAALSADVSRSGASASTRQRQTSISCPRCGFAIAFVTTDLLLGKPISCTACSLTMDLGGPAVTKPQNT